MSTPRIGPVNTRGRAIRVGGSSNPTPLTITSAPTTLPGRPGSISSGNDHYSLAGSTSHGDPGPQLPQLTPEQQFVNQKYEELFDRPASFGTIGGADYWVDKLVSGEHTEADVIRALQGSQEAQTGTLGGLNESLSMAENAALGNVWAGHFAPGGALSAGTDLSNTIWAGLGAGAGNNWGTSDAATAANNIAASVGYVPNTLSGEYYNTGLTGGLGPLPTYPDDGDDGDTTLPHPPPQIPYPTNPNTSGGLTIDDLNAWWAQQNQNQNSGMDDFMRFMMLMSVMGNSGMGGGGYGGSQYGYGGLTPGGVHPSSNSLEHLQGLGSWFQDNFGSGGATTGTVNTGTGTT